MPDKSRGLTCIAVIAMLAILISCEAANAGPQHRKMLQSLWGSGNRNWNRNSNLGPNTVRSQASTSQAITEAVNNGGSLGATRCAGYVGTSGTWALTQGNRVFDLVDRRSNLCSGKRKQ